jgi:hypothetical protein
VRWKSARKIAFIDDNTDAEIANALQFASNVRTSERSAVETLDRLHGIGVPMASAILTMIHPEKYTIIDVRALQSLAVNKMGRHCKLLSRLPAGVQLRWHSSTRLACEPLTVRCGSGRRKTAGGFNHALNQSRHRSRRLIGRSRLDYIQSGSLVLAPIDQISVERTREGLYPILEVFSEHEGIHQTLIEAVWLEVNKHPSTLPKLTSRLAGGGGSERSRSNRRRDEERKKQRS